MNGEKVNTDNQSGNKSLKAFMAYRNTLLGVIVSSTTWYTFCLALVSYDMGNSISMYIGNQHWHGGKVLQFIRFLLIFIPFIPHWQQWWTMNQFIRLYITLIAEQSLTDMSPPDLVRHLQVLTICNSSVVNSANQTDFMQTNTMSWLLFIEWAMPNYFQIVKIAFMSFFSLTKTQQWRPFICIVSRVQSEWISLLLWPVGMWEVVCCWMALCVQNCRLER